MDQPLGNTELLTDEPAERFGVRLRIVGSVSAAAIASFRGGKGFSHSSNLIPLNVPPPFFRVEVIGYSLRAADAKTSSASHAAQDAARFRGLQSYPSEMQRGQLGLVFSGGIPHERVPRSAVRAFLWLGKRQALFSPAAMSLLRQGAANMNRVQSPSPRLITLVCGIGNKEKATAQKKILR